LTRELEYKDRVEALYHLHAHRWEAMGDMFAALRAIEWLKGRDSTANLGSLHFTLGEAAYARPDYDEAIREYLLGLSRGGGAVVPEIFLHLGDAYERRRNCAAAIEHFQRYVEATTEKSERNRDARYRLGTCAFRVAERSFAVGDYRSAAEYAELMIQTGEPISQLDEADLLLGRVYERFGDRTAAMRKYQQVVDRNPERQSRTVVEAYRRLMQLEFGMPLRAVERDSEGATPPPRQEADGEAP
jgi:tetratricopeptide (TPR) repeat protein